MGWPGLGGEGGELEVVMETALLHCGRRKPRLLQPQPALYFAALRTHKARIPADG